MDKATASTDISGLGTYIKDTLFEQWKNDRQPLEDKWQRNLDAFKAVSRGQWKEEEAEDWRSDTFIQVTKIKILAAWSLVVDMFLQGGKLPFSLQQSPYSAVSMEGAPDEVKIQVDQSIEEMIALIHDQLADCQADQSFMKCAMSSAIYGETYGKKFVHSITRDFYQEKNLGEEYGLDTEKFKRFVKDSVTKSQPAWRYASVWDIFRDIEEDDLHAGTGIIERQLMSTYQLRKLKGQPFYLDEAIDNAISAAPKAGDQAHTGNSSDNMAPRFRDIKHRTKNIEVLEFWGRAPRVVVEAYEEEFAVDRKKPDNQAETGLDTLRDYENDGDEVEVTVIVAGDGHVIRFARTEPEDRPYYRAVWEISLDEAHGTGVADNLEGTQRVLNGAVRTFEDNKKLSANVMLAVKKRLLSKGDQVFKPGAEIEIADECDDVRQAIQQIVFQDVGDSLLSAIALFERYADEASQLPKIMQGETAEKKKPDTLGELNMLQQNAGKYLGGVIKNHDEGLIEPIITDFYQYNMDDPDNDKGKGNFTVQALGFTSFQNRVTRLEKIMTFLNLVLQDEELRQITKVKDMIREVAKALDLDPDDVVKTDEELTADQEQAMALAQQAEAEAQAQMAEDQARENEIQERQLMVNDQKHRQDIEREDRKFNQELFREAVTSRKTEPKKEAVG